MVKDIVRDRWIRVQLYVFDVNDKNVTSTEKKLTNFAKEISWLVYKEKNKQDKFDIYIAPKIKLISPLEIEKLYPKILDLTKKIASEFDISKEGAIIIEDVKDRDISAMRNREMVKVFQKILVLKFKLRYRILLEETDFHLANFIFRSSLYLDFEPTKPFRKFLNKISKIAEMKSREKIRKLLYESCAMDYHKSKPLNSH